MVTKKGISNEEREQIYAQAMETPEGRMLLAQTFVEPIKRALDYQAVGRKLIKVDELPQGELPRYEKDVSAIATILSKRGNVPTTIVEGTEVLVPMFEIAVNPIIRLSEAKARRFYIIDRAQLKSKDAIQRKEDTKVFATLDAAVSLQADHLISQSGELAKASLSYAMYQIEEHDLVCTKIVMHPQQFQDLRNWGRDEYDEATRREVLMTGLFGHLWTADIHVSTQCPKGYVYLLAPADYVGAMPIRQDITVIQADEPKRLSLGWVLYLELGMTVLNNYAISRIHCSSTS